MNEIDGINLPQGSYVTLPKDEYLELSKLKDKDYDFEKRVNEIKSDYDEKYDKFLKSKTVSVSNWGHFCSSTTLLKVEGLQKELLEWLNERFNIERISHGYYETEIWTRDGKLFVNKDKVKEEYEKKIEWQTSELNRKDNVIGNKDDIIKKKDKAIAQLNENIFIVEKENIKLKKRLSFMNVIRTFLHIK